MPDLFTMRGKLAKGRSLLSLTACGGLLASCGAVTPTPVATHGDPAIGASSAVSPRPDIAGPVDLGDGRTIYLQCRGGGGPTVVLVTGLGERADDWMTFPDPAQAGPAVYPAVAQLSRVCAYDRPGTAKATATGWEAGRSTPVQRPATVKDSAADLNRLLTASGEPGPYVLVGHSLGGPIVRLYAGEHPSKVVGLVLVDALSEDLGDGLTPEQLANFEQLNDPAVQGRPAGSEETIYSAAVVPQLRAAPPPPTVPTIVLSADTWQLDAAAIATGALPPFVDQAFADALWAAQLVAQDKLAAKFPGAKHISKTGATHYIHHDQPQLVVDAIRQVIEDVRGKVSRRAP